MKKPTTPVTQSHDRAPTTVSTPTLEQIREGSLRARSDAARTIAELESWRDEIDATIAFLKAQGGGGRR